MGPLTPVARTVPVYALFCLISVGGKFMWVEILCGSILNFIVFFLP
jgi:hypothetical protein